LKLPSPNPSSPLRWMNSKNTGPSNVSEKICSKSRGLPPAVLPSSEANDYLLAHQGFSPRVSLQGMAPYVLTVAEHPAEARK